MKAMNLALLGALLFGPAAHAGIITYVTTLSGASEVPPTGSPGTGSAFVIVDTTLQTMEVDETFAGLLGTTTASHIHCCTATPLAGNAGVATQVPYFTGFPLGVTSGSYDHTFDLTLASTYNPAFITAEGGTVALAEAALLGGLAAGETYLNIHSNVDPSGEIRGYLVPAASVPEPATFLVTGALLVGLAIRRRCGLRSR